jgi:hypothetical protein
MASGDLDISTGQSVSFRTSSAETQATSSTAAITMTEVVVPRAPVRDYPSERRRTPRKSLIVVLPDNHTIRLEELAARLPVARNADEDVIVAWAGQHSDLDAFQRAIGGAQFLMAPPGTSTAELRQLAMTQAPGDIVTLLNAAILLEKPAPEQPLSHNT